MTEMFNFRPVQSGRLVEDIVIQIEAAITSGEITTGERLPSERQLQQLFQTGRGAVREALSILKQKGLVEIRKGARGGAFVREIDVMNISQSLSLFMTQRAVSPESVIEFRESVDRMIAVLAISRSSRESREKLLRLSEKFRDYAASGEYDPVRIGEMDRELNAAFAALSGNPVVEWVMNALQLGFSSYDYALYEDDENRMTTAENWVDTTREIFMGEPLKALSYISNHYTLLRRCVNRKLEAIDRGNLATGSSSVDDNIDNITNSGD